MYEEFIGIGAPFREKTFGKNTLNGAGQAPFKLHTWIHLRDNIISVFRRQTTPASAHGVIRMLLAICDAHASSTRPKYERAW